MLARFRQVCEKVSYFHLQSFNLYCANFSSNLINSKMPGRGRTSKSKSDSKVEKSSSKRKSTSKDAPASKRTKAKEEPAENGTASTSTKMNPTTSTFTGVDYDDLQKSSDKKSCNFKISSWNAGGLRALLKKGGFEYVDHEKPDIFCLQEIKVSESKLPPEAKIPGYHDYWATGKKEGYSGVALYSKKKPLSVKVGLGIAKHDEEGRVLTAEYDDFYLVNAYVPNSGRGLVTLPKRMEWNKDFHKYLENLDKKKPVILTGDLNVSHQEIDLARPKTNTKSAGFTQEERDGFSDLLSKGFLDTFRVLYPDKKDAYSYWTYMMNARSKNVGWRLDYFVISERLRPKLCDSIMRSHVMGSDHCPIVLGMHM